MRALHFFGFCILAFARTAHPCSPPTPMRPVPGPAGSSVPYFNEYAHAYIGKVIGYSKNEWGDPSLDVQVLDAWTPQQKNGDILKVSVQPWSGCGLPRERGSFDPTKYPVGTRLRVVTFSAVIDESDAEIALVVLGVAP